MPLTSRTFDQLIDFTRTSAATFVGSNGLIQTTPQSVNLLTFTQEFDNGAWSKNAITVSANTTATTAPDGTSTADKFVENSGTSVHNNAQTATVTISTAYTVSVYAKAAERTWLALDPVNPGISNNVTYFDLANGVVGTNAAGNTASIVSVGNGWYRCIVTRTTTGTQTSLRVEVGIASANNTASYTGNGTSGIYVWGAQLEVGATATTYTRNFGGVFPPRFDYDPVSLAPRGLLVEQQVTNLAIYSQAFDDASWTKTAATVTANATTSPDGSTNADTLVEDTSNNTHRVFQSIACATSTAHTFSVFVKAAGRTQVYVLETALGGAFFDLTNNTITGITAGVTASIETFPNGWRRCRITATTGGAQTTFVAQVQAAIGINNVYTGNGAASLELYGAQLEAFPFASSYIPTVASQVTRSADIPLIQAPNFAPWYNQSEGSFIAEFTPDTTVASNLVRVLVASQVSASARVVDIHAGIGVWQSFNGTTNIVGGASAVTSVPQKFGAAFRAGDYVACLNGGTVGTATTATVNSPSQLALGYFPSGNVQQLNGHLRRIVFYPTRLTNAQLQALTL